MPRKKKPKVLKTYELARGTSLSEEALPVIQNLSAQGYSIADIGLILGYAGTQPKHFMQRLQQQNPEIKNAIELGRKAVDVELIKTAFKETLGYWIEEEEIEYTNVPYFETPTSPRDNEPKEMIDKFIATKKKTKKRFVQPNTQLLFKLMCNRMPTHFSDVRRVEVDKKTMEIKANLTENEIKAFAGQLYSAIADDSEIKQSKIVDSHEVRDAEFEKHKDV